MVTKILGYILAVVGIVALAAGNITQVRTLLQIPATFTDIMLMIAGAVLAVVGIFLITKGGRKGKQSPEVPIYRGRNIVGYRRMK